MWTTEKPTKPGVYRLRGWRSVVHNERVPDQVDPELVRLDFSKVPFAIFWGAGSIINDVPMESVVKGEWAGPMETPK